MDVMRLADTIEAKRVERRQLLARLGAGGLGAAVLASGGLVASTAPAKAQSAPTDIQIMQFALNFEYLGAELYLRALTGIGLGAADTSGIGLQGVVTAGGPVTFNTPPFRSLITKFADDELAHVRLLRASLGANAIAEPSINLTSSFNTIAQTAGFIAASETFSPFNDEISILIASYTIEDVCVTALTGAVGLLTNAADVTVTAGLLGTEAGQAGAVRLILSLLNLGYVTDAISNLRASLSGAADDFGTSQPGNSFNVVSNDANGLVFPRTTSQVLNVAYGGGAAANFGFFPNRVNGPITS